jgi:hypothetical protein
MDVGWVRFVGFLVRREPAYLAIFTGMAPAALTTDSTVVGRSNQKFNRHEDTKMGVDERSPTTTTMTNDRYILSILPIEWVQQ